MPQRRSDIRPGKIVVTTTIPVELYQHLHETGEKLSKWIERQLQASEMNLAGFFGHNDMRIQALTRRLDEQARARFALEEKIKELEARVCSEEKKQK